ncbi:peroxiredoxin [Winogradskyella sp.]|uniref:peroxiredoxin family protein n=1 Tax=Winogradskyella sp. TaxID=1883156 RepID=UPI00260B99EB|nr:redoxin domain-containing protein [Winogradskyella sp.]
MKTYLRIGIIVIVVATFVYLGFKVGHNIQKKIDSAERLETIPDFEFQSLEDDIFTKDSLKANMPTLLIYFNSTCDFCQHEAKSIVEHLEDFKNVQLLFISEEPKHSIKTFAVDYKLYNQQNITFLHDNTHKFTDRFDANTIPYLLVYNEKGKLIKRHKGQLNAKGILKLLHQKL